MMQAKKNISLLLFAAAIINSPVNANSVEKASAIARAISVSLQAHSNESSTHSPQTRRMASLAASCFRLINGVAQYSANKDLDSQMLLHGSMLLCELAEPMRSHYNNQQVALTSLGKVRKIARILSGYIEGTAAIVASTYEKTETTQTKRSSMYALCSSAYCIEKMLAQEIRVTERVIMGLAALLNLAVTAKSVKEKNNTPKEKKGPKSCLKKKKSTEEKTRKRVQFDEETLTRDRSKRGSRSRKELRYVRKNLLEEFNRAADEN